MGDASQRAWGGPSTARRFVRRGTDVSSAPLAVRVSHTLSGRLRHDDALALKAGEQPGEDLWDWRTFAEQIRLAECLGRHVTHKATVRALGPECSVQQVCVSPASPMRA